MCMHLEWPTIPRFLCVISSHVCVIALFALPQVQAIVDEYKNANLMISKNCIKISEMLLVTIDGKRVYDNLEFEDDQVGFF